jgi:hypothetical protein
MAAAIEDQRFKGSSRVGWARRFRVFRAESIRFARFVVT